MRVTDIFNTMGFELLFTQGNTIQESNYKWLTRRFYLTLSYRFGRMDDKKSGKNGDGKSGGDEFQTGTIRIIQLLNENNFIE